MKNFTLDSVVRHAKSLGSYFITITTKDKSRTANDLTHYVFQNEFALADIMPSLDKCVSLLDEPSNESLLVEDALEKQPVERKPLKIAIITHFNRMPQSYSPARAVKNQIKILTAHGHEVVFFTQENSKLTKEEVGCEVRPLVPLFRREKMVVNEEMKNKFIQVLKEQLTDKFDLAITHDFFLQDTVTYSEAVRECGVQISWLHFARSGIAHDMTFAMPNAKFVYLNHSDLDKFAKSIKVPVEQCRTVFNEKEISYMFDFHPVTTMIINRFKLWEKDIIMTYPMCSTRLAAKGLEDVVKVFAELKKLGKKVCLIIPNANGRRRIEELQREVEIAKSYGLDEGEFIFTSLLADKEYQIESEVPNQVCAELMQVSNLFVAASRAEVGPNILLEASMAKNLIVINSDLQLNYDFVDKTAVLEYPFTSNGALHYHHRGEDDFKELAEQIISKLDQNWTDKQFRFVWRQHNAEAIYQMLSEVLYEDIK